MGLAARVDGLRGLARRAAMHALSVRGVIESMNGARFGANTKRDKEAM